MHKDYPSTPRQTQEFTEHNSKLHGSDHFIVSVKLVTIKSTKVKRSKKMYMYETKWRRWHEIARSR